MNVRSSIYIWPVIAALALIAGCGASQEDIMTEAAQDKVDNWKPSISKPVLFELPYKHSRAISFIGPTYVPYRQRAVTMNPYQFETGKWQLIFTMNAWSSVPEKHFHRAGAMDGYLWQIRTFRDDNDLDLDIVFIQTDTISKLLGADRAAESSGRSLSPTDPESSCELFYSACADRYIISPFDRRAHGDFVAQRDWLKPYFHFDGGSDKADPQSVLHHMGFDNPNSKYWDETPNNVFLVNPDGVVVDAWIPLTNEVSRGASTTDVYAMLVRGLNLDPEKIILNKREALNIVQTPYYVPSAKFGGDYIQIPLDNILGVLSEIAQ